MGGDTNATVVPGADADVSPFAFLQHTRGIVLGCSEAHQAGVEAVRRRIEQTDLVICAQSISDLSPQFVNASVDPLRADGIDEIESSSESYDGRQIGRAEM
jgi:hypothetical protein